MRTLETGEYSDQKATSNVTAWTLIQAELLFFHGVLQIDVNNKSSVAEMHGRCYKEVHKETKSTN